MKTIHKLLFVTLIVTCFQFDLKAQSGWSASRYYANRGGVGSQCGATYVVNNTDGWSVWREGWQNCRKRKWYQEYYSGYVYLWGPRGWYREWKEGYYWYFVWYDYRKRIW